MFHHLTDVVEGAAFNLDFQIQPLFFEVGCTAVERFVDAATEVDMVVFEENHIKQADAVIGAAANLHRLFFQHAHTGRGFAGVEHAGAGAFESFHVALRHGGDTAHALHDVEHQSLCLKKALRLSAHHESHITGLNVRTVFEENLHLKRRVEFAEHFAGNAHTGQDALFFDE